MIRRPLAAFLVCFGVVFAVAALGSAVTLPKIGTWYAGLVKPAFTPPNAVFGPAWSVLYAMVAIAGGRVLAYRRQSRGADTALRLFWVQLALNAVWSPAFFGLESPRLGLAVIVALLAAVLVTIMAFWPVDRLGGLLLVPYAAWVAFACVLNAAIVALN